MKQLFTVIGVMLYATTFWAQAPEKMSYQAVVRNPANALVTSQIVGMQISILQGSVAGSAVYIETQTPTTNINGLVSIEIGTGTVLFGSITAIDWANGPYFIQTETDPTGGSLYTITGTSELLSVPYALHAKTAENIIGGITETDPVFGVSVANGITASDTTFWNNHFSGDYMDLNNAPSNVSAFTNDAGYLNSFSEIDPKIGANIAGFSPKWDGSVLVTGAVYQDSTNKVGIGTTSPSARLHIGNGTRFVASSDASIFLQSGNGGGSARDWKIYVPMPDGYLAFRDMGFDNLNNGMANDALAIQWGTGNIGVGTTTPNTKLQVYGNSGSLLKLQTSNIMNTAGQSIGITFTTSADTETGRIEAITESNGNIGMRFYTYSAGVNERLRISSTGNVGVGTNAPSEKLEVNGNLLFTGTSTVSAAAGQFNLTVRAGDGPASGGKMTIRGGQAGSATGGAGGDLDLQGGGNMPSGGAGYGNLGVAGTVNITGGMGYNSKGGSINIFAGATSCWALGGAVHSDVTIRGGQNYAIVDAASIVLEGGYVNGGCSGNSTGGNLILKSGVGQGSGPAGKILMIGLPIFANNAAAVAGGMPIGSLYRTGADPDPICVVH